MGLDAEECAKAAAIGSAAGPADRRRRRRLISEEEKNDGQSMEGPKGESVGGAPLFDIPELPRGQMLLFELLAAWGDDCLIGLRFVEMFTADGTRPALADIQSNAVDMISGTLRSLFRVTDDGREGEEEDDGEHNGAAGGGRRNSADDEMWLCKYNSEGLQQRRLSTAPIQIAVHFCDPQTLAMIRISNYAGPDGHDALRGVRSLRIWLDDQCIFCGEICCAFPSVAGGDDDGADSSIGDTILFTTNDEILTRIAANDGAMESADGDTEGDDQIGTFSLSQPPAGGPSVESAALSRLAFSTRPTTGHLSSPSPSPSALSAVGDDRRRRKWSAEVRTDEGRPAVEGAAAAEDGAGEEAEGAEDEDTENAIVGRIFHMELLANWGCPDAIGLAGIQFLGPKFEPIADHLAMECVVRCEPPGGDDERPNGGGELANLLNGANLTCKADQMWLRPQWNAQGPAPMLSFAFAQEICICGGNSGQTFCLLQESRVL